MWDAIVLAVSRLSDECRGERVDVRHDEELMLPQSCLARHNHHAAQLEKQVKRQCVTTNYARNAKYRRNGKAMKVCLLCTKNEGRVAVGEGEASRHAPHAPAKLAKVNSAKRMETFIR